MAYDEIHAERVRDALVAVPGITERKMFGSLGFLLNGHLTVGVGDGRDGSIIMVRIGKEAEEAALKVKGASITDMGGREMHGWIDLTPDAVATEDDLQKWMDLATKYVLSLPPKSGK